jgi:glyoxylase-like metal-dependent hydrolase (beta-lactamase superfamily II)
VYKSDQFTFEQLGEGVWAAIARPGAGASSNSGIVDTGMSSLVFDTSMTPRSARELRTAARILSGKEPLEVVNSHWHLGHTLGNRIFGGCTIRATRITQELLGRQGATVAAQVNDPAWSRSAAAAEAQRDAEPRPLFREELTSAAAARRDLGDSRDAVSIRLPDETFSGRYFYPGHRDVMIVEGAGHSESDTILFVPDEEVMFTGDLVVVGSHPDLRSSDPDRWLEALGRIEKAQPRKLVPGHGRVTEVGACAGVARYLRHIREIARDSDPFGVPPEFSEWGRPSLFAQNVAVLRAARGT